MASCFASVETGGIASRAAEIGQKGLWSKTLKKERQYWVTADRIKLLRQHLVKKHAISNICDENKLSPSLFDSWQELLCTNGGFALATKRVPHRESGGHRAGRRAR